MVARLWWAELLGPPEPRCGSEDEDWDRQQIVWAAISSGFLSIGMASRSERIFSSSHCGGLDAENRLGQVCVGCRPPSDSFSASADKAPRQKLRTSRQFLAQRPWPLSPSPGCELAFGSSAQRTPAWLRPIQHPRSPLSHATPLHSHTTLRAPSPHPHPHPQRHSTHCTRLINP